jgi:hypothetical protein
MCVAAAIAGAAVVGAGASAYAANKAAGAQESAANQASNTQMGMFNRIQQNEQPYLGAGNQAIQQLQKLYGLGGSGMSGAQIQKLLTSLPGYQFQLGQGTEAIDRSQAARGLLNSGATGKALTRFGQGYAGNYFGQYVGGLQNMAGMGQASAAQQAQVGMNAANQIGGNQIYAGNAAASGYAGMGNAINNGLMQGAGLYGLSQGWYGQQNTGYAGPSGTPQMNWGNTFTDPNSGYTYNTP